MACFAEAEDCCALVEKTVKSIEDQMIYIGTAAVPQIHNELI